MIHFLHWLRHQKVYMSSQLQFVHMPWSCHCSLLTRPMWAEKTVRDTAENAHRISINEEKGCNPHQNNGLCSNFINISLCRLFRENSIKFELGIINKTHPASDIKGEHKYLGNLTSFLGTNEFLVYIERNNTSYEIKRRSFVRCFLGFCWHQFISFFY